MKSDKGTKCKISNANCDGRALQIASQATISSKLSFYPGCTQAVPSACLIQVVLTGHGAVVTTKYEVTQRVQRTSLCRSAESPCASWQRSSVQDLDRIKRKCFAALQRTNWRNEVRIYFPINLDFFILTPSPFSDSEKCIEIQKPFLGLNSSCCV